MIYWKVSQIARMLGWSRARTRAWLLRSGALVRRGGMMVTTTEILRDAFPEVAAAIQADQYDPDEDPEL